ncbi:MAG: chromate transporter, partial [Pseudoflavonifractor sp.]
MNKYLDLFTTFAKVGVCTFGGGYAMLPLLQREVVEKKHWATEDQLTDYFAIGQCTPGVIAVNTATFVGYTENGVLGGIAATLGLVFPSVVIIAVIALCLHSFADLPVV